MGDNTTTTERADEAVATGTCEWCNEPFERPSRQDRKYHDGCRYKAYAARHPRKGTDEEKLAPQLDLIEDHTAEREAELEALREFFPPYVKHSRTSLEAARSICEKAPTARLKVLAFLKTFGPATDEEMQEKIPMNPNTQRPRRVELVRLGLVRDSGETAQTRWGHKATVWEAVNVD